MVQTVHVLNKNNDNKYSVFIKVRPLLGSRTHIGRRLHVNQPAYLTGLEIFVKIENPCWS